MRRWFGDGRVCSIFQISSPYATVDQLSLINYRWIESSYTLRIIDTRQVQWAFWLSRAKKCSLCATIMNLNPTTPTQKGNRTIDSKKRYSNEEDGRLDWIKTNQITIGNDNNYDVWWWERGTKYEPECRMVRMADSNWNLLSLWVWLLFRIGHFFSTQPMMMMLIVMMMMEDN